MWRVPSTVPGRTNNHESYKIEGRQDKVLIMQTSNVDYDFLDTYGITLVSGRFFSESYSSDREACLVNESAVKNFSITDPEKTRIIEGNKYLSILGVVRDFNFESLHNPVQPYIFRFQDENSMMRYITIRLSALNYSKTISAIEAVWKEYTENSPLQYYFVDEDFAKMYKQEASNAKLAVIVYHAGNLYCLTWVCSV